MRSYSACSSAARTSSPPAGSPMRRVYGSTPAYKPVFDCHGWGELQPELNGLSKQGKWAEMGNLIEDEILDAFCVVAEPEKVAGELKRRYDDVVDRVSFYAPYKSDAERWRPVFEELKA